MGLKRKLTRRAKKQNKDEWSYTPRAASPEPVEEPEPERDPQEVKLACELVLLFALLHKPRHKTEMDTEWIVWCQEMAMARPGGSYSHVFFWSMRTLGTKNNLSYFREYLAWKWNEFESGKLRRRGPKWV